MGHFPFSELEFWRSDIYLIFEDVIILMIRVSKCDFVMTDVGCVSGFGLLLPVLKSTVQ